MQVTWALSFAVKIKKLSAYQNRFAEVYLDISGTYDREEKRSNFAPFLLSPFNNAIRMELQFIIFMLFSCIIVLISVFKRSLPFGTLKNTQGQKCN